jgi:hypothetical protein
LLVLPTGTLPKFRAVGLALKTEVVKSAVEVAELVETPLALVTPEQPDKTRATSRIVANAQKERTQEILRGRTGVCPK